MSKEKKKREIFKATREKWFLTHKGHPINLTSSSSSEIKSEGSKMPKIIKSNDYNNILLG